MLEKMKEWWNETVTHLKERKEERDLRVNNCYITLSQIVLFVPGTTGPCSATMFGLQLSGECTNYPNSPAGCNQTYMQYQVYTLDSNCNPTFFEQSTCAPVLGYYGCGATFNSIYYCFAFTRPFTGFPTGNYKIVMNFYDNSACSGVLIAQKIEYLEFQSGFWSVIGKPSGCP